MIQTGTIVMSISNNVITRNSGNFISEGFEVGNKITIFNSSDNTGVFTIMKV